MRQQEELAQQRREQAAAAAPDFRPVGRPPMDPASRPSPKEKRPVGKPCASTHVQAPPLKCLPQHQERQPRLQGRQQKSPQLPGAEVHGHMPASE